MTQTAVRTEINLRVRGTALCRRRRSEMYVTSRDRLPDGGEPNSPAITSPKLFDLCICRQGILYFPLVYGRYSRSGSSCCYGSQTTYSKLNFLINWCSELTDNTLPPHLSLAAARTWKPWPPSRPLLCPRARRFRPYAHTPVGAGNGLTDDVVDRLWLRNPVDEEDHRN